MCGQYSTIYSYIQEKQAVPAIQIVKGRVVFFRNERDLKQRTEWEEPRPSYFIPIISRASVYGRSVLGACIFHRFPNFQHLQRLAHEKYTIYCTIGKQLDAIYSMVFFVREMDSF